MLLSLRSQPFWNPDSLHQKQGLVDLINFIYNQNKNLTKWLEIGSYTGESAEIFLSFDFIEKLYSIDIWTKLENTGYLMGWLKLEELENVKNKFFERLDNQIKKQRCFPIEGSSEKIFFTLDEKFDVVYYDGNHVYQHVFLNLLLWYLKINDNGYICGHDYIFDRHSSLYESTEAIQDFINTISNHSTPEFHVFQDGSWIVKKEQNFDTDKYKKAILNIVNSYSHEFNFLEKDFDFLFKNM